jgi:hypothetical protein
MIHHQHSFQTHLRKGKVQKFTEIIKMVDDMVVILGKEQAN